MKKQYWTIIQPDGEVYLRKWWTKEQFAIDYVSEVYALTWEHLITDGYRVVKIWVEIEGE